MLKVCENCEYRTSLGYEELKIRCGMCREALKVDMVDHATSKDPFKGKRYNGGRKSKLNSKLILLLYSEGKTQVQLAKLFNVTQAAISYLLKREGKLK